METLSITAFDVAVLAVIGLSLVFAFVHGFVSELLGLLAWGGAIFLTIFGYAWGADFTRQYVSPDFVADLVTLVALFIASLMVLKLLATFIGDRVRQSNVGFLDRSLGALFGVLRGILVVSAVYLAFLSIWSFFGGEKTMPPWIKEARTRPLVGYGAEMLGQLSTKMIDRIKENEEVTSILDDMRENAPPEGDPTDLGPSHTQADADAMNRIFEEVVGRDAQDDGQSDEPEPN